MDLRLSGKKVLISGASQGIGLGLAEVFAAEGCNLHLVARSGSKMTQLVQRLRSAHDIEVTVQEQDLAAAGAATAIAEAAGRIDILVNNAGAIPGGDLWQVDAESWRRG